MRAEAGLRKTRSRDRGSPLIGKQLTAISQLAKRTLERSLPTRFVSTAEVPSPVTIASDAEISAPDVHSTHHFHQWYTDVDARKKVEWEERCRCHSVVLRRHVQVCDELLNNAERIRASLLDMKVNYRSVKGRGNTLQSECARLESEKKSISEFAQVMKGKLENFDELESITKKFQVGLSKVDGEFFVPMLHQLDKCTAFIDSRPQYHGFSKYSLTCNQLRSRALSAVRSHVFATLRTAATLTRSQILENEERTSTGSHNQEQLNFNEMMLTSVYHVKFRSAVSCLKPIMSEINKRTRSGVTAASRKEYAQVSADCRAIYCEQRLALILDVVKTKLADYSTEQSLNVFIRTGCAYLLQVCRAERELFECAFPLDDEEVLSAMWLLVEPLGSVLQDALRPRYIVLTEIQSLAEVIDVLNAEILEEQLDRHGDAGRLLRPFVETVLADVRERLIFRAQTFIKTEVENYRLADDDLDYPAKLNCVSLSGTTSVANDKRQQWFPPLENTLSCLAILYRSLDARTFSGLAQDAVHVCSDSIQQASRHIMNQSSDVDGQLFAIKHLLVLREQISPFEPDLAAHSVPVRELDFSHVRGQMSRMLAGDLSFFSTTSDANGLLSLAASGAPRVVESTLDSRRELERHLKIACEAYIMSVTRQVVEPMLGFITKVTALRVSGRFASGTRVRDAAFATPARLSEVVSRVNDALSSDLPACVRKMSLYITGAATREIIFNPIKSNIAEAHSQIASLLEAEYEPENVDAIKLKSPAELEQLMSGVWLTGETIN